MRIVLNRSGPRSWTADAAPESALAPGGGRLRRWLIEGPARWGAEGIPWQPRGPVAQRLRDALQRLLTRLQRGRDPAEPLLLRLGLLGAGEDIEVEPPSATRVLRVLLRRALGRHGLGLLLNVLLLPLTVLLTLVPGPNVFLLWNAYRLVGHALALRGAQRGLRALHDLPRPPPPGSRQEREARGTHAEESLPTTTT